MRNTFIHYTPKNGGPVTMCISRYAGKVVKGIAKCSPNDVYDEAVGEKLALLRCNQKVAEKRAAMADKRVAMAMAEVEKANAFLAKMQAYRKASIAELTEAIEAVGKAENDVK